MKIFIKISVLIIITFSIIMVVKYYNDEGKVVMSEDTNLDDYSEVNLNVSFMPDIVFEKHDISEEVKERIMGKSYKENNNITFSDLKYLKMSFIDFEGETKVGEMIVNEKVADEVLEIFKALYETGYQIERMELIDEYDANDFKSIENNNTSAFCYRNIEGTDKLSNHALGMAIDINPLQNPYVTAGKVQHEGSQDYIKRDVYKNGMISEDCIQIFKSYGWEWGGDWSSIKDYQHFEKKM